MVVAAFPQASVALKMTSTAPLPAQVIPRPVKLLLQVTLLQSSVASPAPPLEANQAARSPVLPKPSHSTVTFVAGLKMVGAVVSSMLKVACVSVEFPLPSVTVKVTMTSDAPPQVGDIVAGLGLYDQVNGPHASLADAPPLLASQVANSEEKSLTPSHSWFSSWAATSMEGAVLSSTVTVTSVVDVFPQSSVMVSVTVFGPKSAHVKAVLLALGVVVPQTSLDPPSMDAALKVPLPVASKVTVAF
jgi:hypothetical protein